MRVIVFTTPEHPDRWHWRIENYDLEVIRESRAYWWSKPVDAWNNAMAPNLGMSHDAA